MQLSSAKAVVTGGASGLGFATAERVVAAGGKVVLFDINDELGEASAAKLGDNAWYLNTNVADESSVQASIAAFEGQIGQAAYSASKGGVHAMMLPLAREFASFGIRVNTIAPGIMLTPMMSGMPQEVQDSLAAQVPFPKRLGKPDEYAVTVQYIYENAYVNSETIRCDGAIRMQAK